MQMVLLSFFSKFFTEEVIHLLVEQTNFYAKQKKSQHWEDTTESELTAFLGMLIAMGIHGLPSFRMFWSIDPLFRVQPVADIMTRQRFMKLVGNLHIYDNDKAVCTPWRSSIRQVAQTQTAADRNK